MSSFLTEPDPSAEVQRLYDNNLAGDGFVMNLTRVWARDPDTYDRYSGLLGHVARDLTFRQKGILVSATASTLGDSYCSLAWGKRLADEVGAPAAAGVLLGDDAGLTPAERTLARWARKVAGDPNRTGPTPSPPSTTPVSTTTRSSL